MTGLWTNDRDSLIAALSGHIEGDVMCSIAADELIVVGVVRVLDPDDTELRATIRDAIADEFGRWHWDFSDDIERATDHVIEALRQP